MSPAYETPAQRQRRRSNDRTRQLREQYARRLTARAKGRLTKAEVRKYATQWGADLYWRYGGSSDSIGHRTPGSFARDFLELKAKYPREMPEFANFCRYRFCHYGPSLWPEERHALGLVGFGH